MANEESGAIARSRHAAADNSDFLSLATCSEHSRVSF
jgi:hypothetical protein